MYMLDIFRHHDLKRMIPSIRKKKICNTYLGKKKLFLINQSDANFPSFVSQTIFYIFLIDILVLKWILLTFL